MTWFLIFLNVLAFLFELSLTPESLKIFLQNFALIPARYFGGNFTQFDQFTTTYYAPFLTNIFLHGGWLHLIFNMWTLYIFAPAIEDRLGKPQFLIFYLICGLGASMAHAFVNANSSIPVLGASGAIAGILGAYMRLFPFSRIIVLILIGFFPLFFELYAFIFTGLWFALQLFEGLSGLFHHTVSGGIAWWAHIGGFILGWLAIVFLHLPPTHYRSYQRDEGVHGFSPNGRRVEKGPWG